jgi:GNAT superfamily N-acetyltransferase
MSGFTIRRAESLSAEACRQLAEILIGVVSAGASVGFLPPLSLEDAEAYWRGVIKPETVLLVAERDGRIIGTGQLELAMRANGRHRAEVGKVLVDPAAQGQGIGKALMLALEAEARRLGRTLLYLDTREGDLANRLYQSVGYTAAGTIPQWAIDSDGTLTGTTIYYRVLE